MPQIKLVRSSAIEANSPSRMYPIRIRIPENINPIRKINMMSE